MKKNSKKTAKALVKKEEPEKKETPRASAKTKAEEEYQQQFNKTIAIDLKALKNLK